MASNPPFQVEDQTDEDFFDKLVDDEFGPPATTGSNPPLADGSDSDDAKAFANLSVGEVGHAFDDFGAEGEKDCADAGTESVGAHAEERNSLVSSNSMGCDSVLESSNDGIGSEFPSDSSVSKSSGSGGLAVKEVGWNSFHADLDSVQNGSKGVGSYSDFFSELGVGSGDFPGNVGDTLNNEAKIVSAKGECVADGVNNSVNYANHQEGQVYGASLEQSTNVQDLNSSQYWDNLYPGWKFDQNTGQWYQVDGCDATAVADVHDSAGDWGAVSDRKTEVSYMQQAAQSVMETVTETSTTESVYSQGNNGYPDHMVFDPQYPGWYYDTIVQEWRALDTYTPSIQSTALTHDQQQHQNGFVSPGSFNQINDSLYGNYGQADNYASQGFGGQGQDRSWAGAYSNNNQQDLSTWATETVPKSEAFMTLGGNQQFDHSYSSKASVSTDQQEPLNSFGAVSIYNGGSQSHGKANGTFEFKSFVPDGNFSQQFSQPNLKPNEQTKFSNDYFGSQKTVGFSQQSFENGHQTSYAPNAGRSSAGRPPHALVTFGFGGKLIVMKDNSPLSTSSYGSQVGPWNLLLFFNAPFDCQNTEIRKEEYIYDVILCFYDVCPPAPCQKAFVLI